MKLRKLLNTGTQIAIQKVTMADHPAWVRHRVTKFAKQVQAIHENYSDVARVTGAKYAKKTESGKPMTEEMPDRPGQRSWVFPDAIAESEYQAEMVRLEDEEIEVTPCLRESWLDAAKLTSHDLACLDAWIIPEDEPPIPVEVVPCP